jgi:hypothetical protein
MDGNKLLDNLGIKTIGDAFKMIADSIEEDDEEMDVEKGIDLCLVVAIVVKKYCLEKIKNQTKIKKIEVTDEEVDRAGFVLYELLMKELASDRRYGKLWKVMNDMKDRDVA